MMRKNVTKTLVLVLILSLAELREKNVFNYFLSPFRSCCLIFDKGLVYVF